MNSPIFPNARWIARLYGLTKHECLSISTLVLVLMAVPVIGEDMFWKDSHGNPMPDTASQKSVNGVAGMLLVTSDDNWEAKWNTSPDTVPHFTEAHTVVVGKALHILTFIGDPTRSSDGTVHITCDFSMQKPDGTYSVQKKDVECLSGPVSQSTLYLSKIVLGFLGEKSDPPGKWIVRLTLKDLIKGAIIPLQTTFILQ